MASSKPAVFVRMTSEEKTTIKRAALSQAEFTNEWAKRVLLKAATEVLTVSGRSNRQNHT